MVVAAPAWEATKKISVQQLKDLLLSLRQARKTDEEAATRLEGVDLSEELAGSAAGSLESYLPGPLSREEIEILKIQSAFLAPPPADLTAVPAPDPAAKKAILTKAADFATKVYLQNPHLSVIKAMLRYEDEIRTTNSVGIHTPDLLHGPIKLVDKRVDPVETDKGVENAAASRAKTEWGLIGRISEGEPGTNLGAIFLEASTSGKVEWLRWQTIEGKQFAVFSFDVTKKNSHFDVNYCCFPKTDTQDTIMGPLTIGAIQSVSTWVPFKKIVGYHGEFFIDPDTGVLVRLITRAEMKPSDLVYREDRRIDYGPVVVDGKEYLLPRASDTVIEAVPNGDNNSAACTTRKTLLHASYQNYKLAEER